MSDIKKHDTIIDNPKMGHYKHVGSYLNEKGAPSHVWSSLEKLYEPNGIFLKQRHEIKSLQQTIDKQNQIIKEFREVLGEIEKGPLHFYDTTYEDANWGFCCSGYQCACQGKPSDPEYFVYQDLKRAREVLAKYPEGEE